MKKMYRVGVSLWMVMIVLFSCFGLEVNGLDIAVHEYTYGNYKYTLSYENEKVATITNLVKKVDTLTIPAYINGIPVGGVDTSLLKQGGFNRFVVEPENLFYQVINGMLCDRSGEVLYRVPAHYKGTLEIPESVTTIRYMAASNCIGISSVKFPKQLKTIELNAFKGCTALQSLSIPQGVRYIESGAFSNCTKLGAIDLPDTVRLEAGVFENTLYEKTKSNWKNGVLYVGNHLISAKNLTLTSFTIPKGTVSIGENAFLNVGQLKEIIIAESVQYIGSMAFSGCSSLQTIVMPKTGCEVEPSAFDESVEDYRDSSVIAPNQEGFYYGTLMATVPYNGDYLVPEGVTCIMNEGVGHGYSDGDLVLPASLGYFSPLVMRYNNRVKNIFVHEENPYYTAIDGVLYDKQVTTLIVCPGGKSSVTVPESVTAIGPYAFQGCKNLTNVKLPKGLKSIGKRAFYSCDSLREIRIPNSVKEFDFNDAFMDCMNLEKVALPTGLTRLTTPIYNVENLLIEQVPYGVKYIAPEYLSQTTALPIYSNSFALDFVKQYGIPYKITKEGPKRQTNVAEKSTNSSASSLIEEKGGEISSDLTETPQDVTITNLPETPTNLSHVPPTSSKGWLWLGCGVLGLGGALALLWFVLKKTAR